MNPLTLHGLLSTSPPWFYRVASSHSDLTDFLWSLQRNELREGIVRYVRGKQMPTTGALFNEFAAALQFPYYFGGNWAAFDECLADLSWLAANGYSITIFDSADLLAKEDESQLHRLLDMLEYICVEWSNPVVSGQAWDRPGVPFHVLFHYVPQDEYRLHERIMSIPASTISVPLPP